MSPRSDVQNNARVLWKQDGKIEEEGVKLFYNGEDTNRNGVGIAVSESFKNSVAAVQMISDRLTAAKYEGRLSHYHAPQIGSPDHDRDEFYLTLEEVIRRGMEKVHEGKRIGLINPDRESILDLAAAHDLVICSIFFAKRESQKATYASGRRRKSTTSCCGKEPSQTTACNVKKTKFISSKQCTESIFDCQKNVIDKVEEFRYLEVTYPRAEAWIGDPGRIPQQLNPLDQVEGVNRNPRRMEMLQTFRGKLSRRVERPACLRDRVGNEDVSAVMKTAPIQLKMREQCPRWYRYTPEDQRITHEVDPKFRGSLKERDREELQGNGGKTSSREISPKSALRQTTPLIG
ncbi:unnamed protein product [Heligmosomoides polygyrus]|uniref:RNase H domain-containing protein n=1 Tax=Heligmosomoides polygyrus TaxID=6339 RepID=A0A183F5R6_HELPZ|nr:unnamed protein product [Heligmosomoides polygyrus]